MDSELAATVVQRVEFHFHELIRSRAGDLINTHEAPLPTGSPHRHELAATTPIAVRLVAAPERGIHGSTAAQPKGSGDCLT